MSESNKKRSDIIGEGYADCHQWVRGPTLGYDSFGRPPPLRERNTKYTCSVCGATFQHYYCVTNDIFEATQEAGVPNTCE